MRSVGRIYARRQSGDSAFIFSLLVLIWSETDIVEATECFCIRITTEVVFITDWLWFVINIHDYLWSTLFPVSLISPRAHPREAVRRETLGTRLTKTWSWCENVDLFSWCCRIWRCSSFEEDKAGRGRSENITSECTFNFFVPHQTEQFLPLKVKFRPSLAIFYAELHTASFTNQMVEILKTVG